MQSTIDYSRHMSTIHHMKVQSLECRLYAISTVPSYIIAIWIFHLEHRYLLLLCSQSRLVCAAQLVHDVMHLNRKSSMSDPTYSSWPWSMYLFSNQNVFSKNWDVTIGFRPSMYHDYYSQLYTQLYSRVYPSNFKSRLTIIPDRANVPTGDRMASH